MKKKSVTLKTMLSVLVLHLSLSFFSFLPYPTNPLPFMCTAFPIIPITPQSGNMLQLMKLHWNLVIWSAEFTLGFTLDIVYSVSLDNIVTCIHQYNIIESILTVLEILCAPCIWHFPFSPTSGFLHFLFCLLKNGIYLESYSI